MGRFDQIDKMYWIHLLLQKKKKIEKIALIIHFPALMFYSTFISFINILYHIRISVSGSAGVFHSSVQWCKRCGFWHPGVYLGACAGSGTWAKQASAETTSAASECLSPGHGPHPRQGRGPLCATSQGRGASAKGTRAGTGGKREREREADR